MNKIFTTLIVIVLSNLSLLAQVKGRLVDASTNEPVTGAIISVPGTSIGTRSGIDGSFNLKADNQDISITCIGYQPKNIAKATGDLGNIELKSAVMNLKDVIVVTNTAIERKTPVAFSSIRAAEIKTLSGNNEFPELMKFTPSTYVTRTGGAFGDSRISVRGYTQENVAVMINGVPVNDMENGKVYWSNWAGLSDVSNQIQIQRGLGASKSSVSSIGGTINIVTKTTDMNASKSVFAGIGNNNMYEVGAAYNSGKMKNGLAVSFLLKLSQGNGYVDGTKYQAATYFGSIGYEINSKHTLQLTVTGAPQWHNQRSSWISYDKYYGDSLGNGGFGRRYNSDWGTLNGEQFSMRKNFYHKPIGFLNHFWNISPKSSLNTSVYYSIGRGGGSGDLGSINGNNITKSIFRNADGTLRFDDIQQWNQGDSVAGFGPTKKPYSIAGEYNGKYVATSSNGIIRRSSMNEHNWWGLVSTFKTELAKGLDLYAGLDFRKYKGLHYRRVENLLGADTYFETSNKNIAGGYFTSEKDGHIAYDNNGLVNQIGGFTTLEYTKDKLTLQASGNVNNTSYQREDFFLYPNADSVKSEKKSYLGYTIKAGANYNVNKNFNIFANVGRFTRAPFFNSVFYKNTNFDINPGAVNEKINSFELGAAYRKSIYLVKLNAYYTQWQDKSLVKRFVQSGVNKIANITGVDANHSGIEIEAGVKPINKLNIGAMLSLGNWKWAKDVTATVINDNTNQVDTTFNLYIKDLKVGDAAQTTFAIKADYEIVKGLIVRASYNYFANLYANFDPASRSNSAEAGRQAWKLPNYGLMDAGVNYTWVMKNKHSLGIKFNVQNVLDTDYISEATTDIPYNKVGGGTNGYLIPNSKNGSSQNSVWTGWGRTWYLGLNYNF